MEKITFNDLSSKILLPILLIAIGFVVTDILKQKEYKLERQKYAAEVLKNVYAAPNAQQGMSYLKFAEHGIDNSKSIFGFFLDDDSLKLKVQKAIIQNYDNLHQEAVHSNDTTAKAQIELAVSNNLDIIKSNSLDQKLNSENLVNKVSNKKIKALEIEKQMYEALNENDYQLTIQKAEELDKFFPQFHVAFEVGKTLKSAQKASKNSPKKRDSIMREAKEKVKNEYNYGYKIN